RPPDTDTVTFSSPPSRLSVATPPTIDAELTAASAGVAVAAKLAASAVASAARMVGLFISVSSFGQLVRGRPRCSKAGTVVRTVETPRTFRIRRPSALRRDVVVEVED